MSLNDVTTAAVAVSPPIEIAFPDTAASSLIAAGETLLKSLSEGRFLSPDIIRAAMTAAFGGTDAEGKWIWKTAYEAIEVAEVLFLRKYLPSLRRGGRTPEEILPLLKKIAALLPTHTRRSEESVALQQFSTPMDLAFLASVAADLRDDDVVLEPSAGTGLLAVFAETKPACLYLNELAETRSAVLEALFPHALLGRFNAEAIDDHLGIGITPSVVIMNPPFSVSPNVKGRMAGIDHRHVKSALARLAPGGRLVAITGTRFAPEDPDYRAWFKDIQSFATLSFTAALDGKIFQRHGTSVETRLSVFDKVPTPIDHEIQRGVCASTEELTALIDTHLPARAEARASLGSGVVVSKPLPAPAKRPRHVLMNAGATTAFTPKAAPTIELTYEVIETPMAVKAKTDAIYQAYAPERIRIPGSKPHPDKLVQSVAMASVAPPKPTYRPHLPAGLVEAGTLSDTQLESLIYAGEAHATFLAGHWRVTEAFDQPIASGDDDADAVRFRRGWFLGDGAGAGKGRQVAGIILDNWLKGRRRAVWISRSETLIEDAQRDWSALGQEKLLVVPQDRYKPAAAITLPEGILFTTYATLRSESQTGATRLNQILDWLGEDFDGVIAFDEAHEMGHAAGGTIGGRSTKPSLQGLAGLKLQHALPDARVIYVSATGATTVDNLAYAQRLGLWGSNDLPFPTREAFVTAMHEGGIASAEVLARDLKALGLYASRSLSYEGIEIDLLEHQLTPQQVQIYDAYANGYQVIHANLTAALEAALVTHEGATMNKVSRTSALSAFEGAKVRFFNHLITAMKIPTLLKSIEQKLAAGEAVVVQLVSTSEALLDRRLKDIPVSQWNDLTVDITPREYVLDYLKHSFPTQLQEIVTDEKGNKSSRPVFDAAGNPVQCRDAVRRREQMIEYLGALPPVQAALDQLIQHFGTDKVAEITGRTKRIVRKHIDGMEVMAVETRSASANINETQAFMDDVKRILVFSNAGSTGRSYHADLGAKNQRLRNHYLLEAGWRADVAIQGLGRDHRTNQRQAPRFIPVATNVRGERRFLSTISRRLDSLGAITRGERKTGGLGLFRASDNLESTYAWSALGTFYELMVAGKIACCSLTRFEEATGLSLLDGDGTLRERLPAMSRFLNRVLALPIALQNGLFEIFEGLLEARVEEAITAGKYDVGLEVIQAESLAVVSRKVVATHPSGAETILLEVNAKHRNEIRQLAHVVAYGEKCPATFLINRKSMRAALMVPASSVTLDDGTVKARVCLFRPTEKDTVREDKMAETHWEEAGLQTFSRAWSAEVAETPAFIDKRLHILTGLLLPVWKMLPYAHPRVFRLTTDAGEAVIGRWVEPEQLRVFHVEDDVVLTPTEAWSRLMSSGTYQLTDRLRAKKVMAMGAWRVELNGYDPSALEALKALGLKTEIISFRTRLFIPLSAEGPAILERLMQNRLQLQAA
jgi:predicted RNA methylase